MKGWFILNVLVWCITMPSLGGGTTGIGRSSTMANSREAANEKRLELKKKNAEAVEIARDRNSSIYTLPLGVFSCA